MQLKTFLVIINIGILAICQGIASNEKLIFLQRKRLTTVSLAYR